MSSCYTVFADYYDALTENVGYAQRAVYFDGLLRRFGNQGGLLLDLACGTGSLSVEMAGKGYDVIGVDASWEMLSVAREKAAQAGADILFLCQKMQRLDLYGTIDAAICALDSINHITNGDDVLRIFQRVSLFLNDGGLFVFDANTIHKHRETLGDKAFIYDLDRVFCAWQNYYEPKNHSVRIQLDFFEKDGNAYYRSSECFVERAYPQEQLCAWLEDAGLEVVAVYGELTDLPPAQEADRLVYVARKHRS